MTQVIINVQIHSYVEKFKIIIFIMLKETHHIIFSSWFDVNQGQLQEFIHIDGVFLFVFFSPANERKTSFDSALRKNYIPFFFHRIDRFSFRKYKASYIFFR